MFFLKYNVGIKNVYTVKNPKVIFIMATQTKRILISVGEASGDMHAANLVQAVKKIDPNIQFYGKRLP